MKSSASEAPLLPSLVQVNVDGGTRKPITPMKTPHKSTHYQRRWLHIDADGQYTFVNVDKHTLVKQLGIPYRDLRILDPTVSNPYPTALFIREKALVVNLESIRMIITKDEVFVLSVPNPAKPSQGIFPTPDCAFVADLIHRLTAEEEAIFNKATANIHVDTTLPYELRALETALGAGASLLESEMVALEERALPSLDRLAQRVSRHELENIRTVKAALNRLLARVGRVKQELESILDDDNDMHDMYLARRADIAEVEEYLASQYASNQLARRASGGIFTQDLPTDALQRKMSTVEEHPDAPQAAMDASAGGPTDSIPPATAGAPLQPAPPPIALPSSGRASPALHSMDGTDGRAAGDAGSIAAAASAVGPAPGGVSPLLTPSGPSASNLGSAARSALMRLQAVRSMRLRMLTQPQLYVDRRSTESSVDPSRHVDVSQLQAAPSAPAVMLHELAESVSSPRPLPDRGVSFQVRSSMGAPPQLGAMRVSGDIPGSPMVPPTAALETMLDLGHNKQAVDPHDIESCEALLEAYFMQVDTTLSRLLILKEKIEATESLIALDLDHRRNELTALDLMVTCITVMFAFVSMVSGVFGMNIYFPWHETDSGAFTAVTLGACAIAFIMFCAIVLYARYKRLLFIPAPSTILHP